MKEENKKLYYVKANPERKAEIYLRLAIQGNGFNKLGLSFDNENGVYFCTKNDIIYFAEIGSLLYDTIIKIGEELVLAKLLPEIKEVNHLCFMTDEQVTSAKAAALISQIREENKDVYGEIVPKCHQSYTFYYDNVVTLINSYHLGGLLRFETKDKALSFLRNNRRLVFEYLQTF